MTTKQDTLEEYKKAIRLKFELEKAKEYSSFLIVPSRAKLRQLCIERFKNNKSTDDLKSFEIFFGFEFELGNKNRLQVATDKFRPIETFLKGDTDLTDIEGINVAAILVNYNPRPFNKFAKLGSNEITEGESFSTEYNNSEGLVKNEENPIIIKSKDFVTIYKSKFAKKAGIGSLVVLGLLGAKNNFFQEKECMEWKQDHYELVDCQSDQMEFVNTKIIKPYNEIEFERKELTVCDTTIFFNSDKPIVWYSKKNKDIQFFNMNGENPENGAELKRISQYIIEKYVGECK